MSRLRTGPMFHVPLWWKLSPWWIKRVILFIRIVWRRYEDYRLPIAVSWDVACLIHKRTDKTRGQYYV